MKKLNVKFILESDFEIKEIETPDYSYDKRNTFALDLLNTLNDLSDPRVDYLELSSPFMNLTRVMNIIKEVNEKSPFDLVFVIGIKNEYNGKKADCGVCYYGIGCEIKR